MNARFLRGAHRIAFVAAVFVVSTVLAGDFCADVLGVPVLVQTRQSVPLQINLAGFLGAGASKSDPVPGDIDLDDVDLDEITGEVDINDVLADVDELLGELDVDLGEIIGNAGIPACTAAVPSPTVPGEGCLCTRPGTPPLLYVKSGCLLGQVGLDLPNLNPQVRKVAKYVKGIFLRRVDWSVYGKSMPADLPPVELEILPIEPLTAEGDAAPPATALTFTPAPKPAPARLVTVGPVGAGNANLPLFNETALGACAALPPPTGDETAVVRAERLLDGLLAAKAAGADAGCGLTVPAVSEVRPLFTDIDAAAAVLQTLRFGVRAKTTADLNVTEQVLRLQGNPTALNLKLRLRLRLEVVLVVVPKT